MADWRTATYGFLATGLALFLAGCASAPPVPHPNVVLPSQWRLSSPAEQLGPAPDLRNWWKVFHNADLNRLVKQVLAQNLDIAAAAERLAAARALETTARGRFRPGLGIQGGATPTPGATRSYYQINFDASWQLGLFGRSTSAARVAAGNAQLASANLGAARVAIVAECVRDYLDLRAAQQRLAIEQRLVKLQRRQLHLQQILVREHLQNATHLAKFRSVLGAHITAVAAARATVRVSAQRIALLLGQSVPPLWLHRAAAPPQPTRFAFKVIPADLLRTRPDIQRAEANVLKAAGKAGIAQADLYPHLALGAGLSWSVSQVGGHLLTSSAIPFFGPLINLPLFDWGERHAALRARNHLLQAALLDYRQTVYTAVAETDTALARLHAAQVRTTQSRAQVQSLLRATKSAEILRQLGLGDGLSLGQSRLRLLQAELETGQARTAEGIALVALYKALGGAALPSVPPRTEPKP